jgi:hypothetical protein
MENQTDKLENRIEKENVGKTDKEIISMNTHGKLNTTKYTLVERKDNFVDVYSGKKYIGKYKCPENYTDCYECNSIYNNKGRVIGGHCVLSVCELLDTLDCKMGKNEQKYVNIVDLMQKNLVK